MLHQGYQAEIINKMENINAKIDNGFKLLTESFNRREKTHEFKSLLQKQEIEAHELLFDEKKLPLLRNVFSNNRPLIDKCFNIKYHDGEIVQIRDAYNRFIVQGADVMNSGKLYKDKTGWYERGEPDDDVIRYYIEAKIRFLYLNWLRDRKPKEISKKGIPEPILKDIYKQFNSKLWNHVPEKEFISLFDPQQQNIIRLEFPRGNQILCAYLFHQVCLKIGIPYAAYLKPRIGKTDGVYEITKDGREPRNRELFQVIQDYLEKMTLKNKVEK